MKRREFFAWMGGSLLSLSRPLAASAQRKVPLMSDDTPESLHARIQEVEHTLYPEALKKVLREIRDR